MPITENISINAPAADVWPYVADPVLMSVWNLKIVADSRSENRLVSLGERFSMTFRMQGRETESSVEVLECTTSERIKLQHTVVWKTKEQKIVESYQLESRNDQTIVTQSIDLSQAIPWPFRIIAWLISKIGTVQGSDGSSLERLKQVVEEDCAD